MKNFMGKRSIQLLVNILPIIKTLEIVGFDLSKKENITINYYSHVQPDRCMLVAHIWNTCFEEYPQNFHLRKQSKHFAYTLCIALIF